VSHLFHFLVSFLSLWQTALLSAEGKKKKYPEAYPTITQASLVDDMAD
jgi:hypothetical protein